MKKALLFFALLLLVCGCGINVKKGTAEVAYTDVIEGCVFEDDYCKIELISYDLGYSGNLLTKGNEVLCIKMHLSNKSMSTASMEDLTFQEWYVDGNESNMFGSDFYGDGSAINNTYITSFRPGAEGDIYICFDCPVRTPHTIEVDIYSRSPKRSNYEKPYTLSFIVENN